MKKWIKSIGLLLDRRFRPYYYYELEESSIVGYRGAKVPIDEIESWQQVFLCYGLWVIAITDTQGRNVEYGDQKGYLINILKAEIPEREIDWDCR